MNKVVREHYPAEKLPQELREGIAAGASVRVTVEVERRPLSREQLLETIRKAQANARGTTLEEAVARVRSLRDEWDD
ncbi:MAG: hypothetical protein AB7S80_08920 [Rhizobiaceae bacterium]